MKATTIADIKAVLQAERADFPMPQPTFVLLAEEVGALAKALLMCRVGFPAVDSQQVYSEALQIAVLAIRLMEEGDQHFIAYTPELLHLDRDLVQ